MGTMTHKIERAAFGKAIDYALKHKDEGWEEGVEKIIDLMQKYMNTEKLDFDYDKTKEKICNRDNTLNRYIDRLLKEVNPNVLKTTAH